jgi:hypothetical protein
MARSSVNLGLDKIPWKVTDIFSVVRIIGSVGVGSEWTGTNYRCRSIDKARNRERTVCTALDLRGLLGLRIYHLCNLRQLLICRLLFFQGRLEQFHNLVVS